MKLLLDENLPRKLKNDLLDFEVYSVQEMGWNGKQNGELLELMLENEFDVLLTGDKNLHNQQNFKKYQLPVIVLNASLITYEHLTPLMPKVKELLSSKLKAGSNIISV